MRNNDTHPLELDLEAIREVLAEELDAGRMRWDVVSEESRPRLRGRIEQQREEESEERGVLEEMQRWVRGWFKRE